LSRASTQAGSVESDSSSQLDVLRAPPRALFIFVQPPKRKPAPLIDRFTTHPIVEKRVTLEDDLKNPLAVTRSSDDIMNVRRDAGVGIGTGFNRAEFIAALRIGAHVTAQARIAIIVHPGRVVAFD